MARTAKLEVKAGDIRGSLQQILADMLKRDMVAAVMVPQHLPMKNKVMPTLVTDPAKLDGVDPLAPSFPVNAAKIVARLTRKPMGAKIAAVMRPCEIRAFIELVKLNQGSAAGLILISIDCLGAYSNRDYTLFAERNGEDASTRFCRHMLSGKSEPLDGIDLADACKACEYPTAANADIQIGIYGVEIDKYLMVSAQTGVGEDFLAGLKLVDVDEPDTRREALETVIQKHTAFRDDMFVATRAQTDSLEKLTTYLADCVNCYNCRVACPVCYCKECVFVTDVFNHEPSQYLKWASRKGVIKLPVDTTFYHLTRLAHMSTACVGCGQCSNACPNDIPVMALFRTISQETQRAFDYEAGRRIDEKPPLSVFREDEFDEVVGLN